jgi:hypothetical protein
MSAAQFCGLISAGPPIKPWRRRKSTLRHRATEQGGERISLNATGLLQNGALLHVNLQLSNISSYEMDLLSESCERFSVYPKNLINAGSSEHNITAYLSRLNHLAERLFVEDGEAALEILDTSMTTEGMSGFAFCFCL